MKTLIGMGMKRLFIIAVLVFLAWDLSPVLASNDAPEKDKGQWYEKSALTVGPVKGFKAKPGSLLVLQAGSAVYMDGNSTLHHYQMNANRLEGSAVLKGSSRNLLKALQKGQVGLMTFDVPVERFKSKDSGLDKNAYVALKSKENPDMKFVLTRETLKAGKDADTYVMTAMGKLTVAGVTIPVILTADTTVKDGQVRLQGIQKLKFTDFNITPPKASIFIVTIVCDDEFEVHYDVLFSAKSDAVKSEKS